MSSQTAAVQPVPIGVCHHPCVCVCGCILPKMNGSQHPREPHRSLWKLRFVLIARASSDKSAKHRHRDRMPPPSEGQCRHAATNTCNKGGGVEGCRIIYRQNIIYSPTSDMKCAVCLSVGKLFVVVAHKRDRLRKAKNIARTLRV